eukprot:tig00001254_g7808.t1
MHDGNPAATPAMSASSTESPDPAQLVSSSSPILQLPDAILQQILLRLSERDRSSCAATCRRIRDILRDAVMWPFLRLLLTEAEPSDERRARVERFIAQRRWRSVRALEAAFAEAESAGHAGRAFPALRHARLTFTEETGAALQSFAAAGGVRRLTSLCLRARFPAGACAAALHAVLEEAAAVRRACLTSALTDAGLAALAAHRSLEALSLLFCLHVGAPAVAAALDACADTLRTLALFPSPGRSPGAVLEAVKGPLPSLRAAFLECLSDEELARLVAAAPRLAVVYLSPHQRIGMRVLDHHVLHTTRIPSLSPAGVASLCRLGSGLRRAPPLPPPPPCPHALGSGLACRLDAGSVSAGHLGALWAACPALEIACLDLVHAAPAAGCPLAPLRDSLRSAPPRALRHLALSAESAGAVSWRESVVSIAQACPSLISLSLFGAALQAGAGIESPSPPLCSAPAGASRSLEARPPPSPSAPASEPPPRRALQRVRIPARLRRADSVAERPPSPADAFDGEEEGDEGDEDEIGDGVEQDQIEASSSEEEDEAGPGAREEGPFAPGTRSVGVGPSRSPPPRSPVPPPDPQPGPDLRRNCPACRRLHVLGGTCCEAYCCGKVVCLYASPWARRCAVLPSE